MFHYSYITRSQIEFKALYWKQPEIIGFWEHLQNNRGLPSVKVWAGQSTAYKFEGKHPEVIENWLNTADEAKNMIEKNYNIMLMEAEALCLA